MDSGYEILLSEVQLYVSFFKRRYELEMEYSKGLNQLRSTLERSNEAGGLKFPRASRTALYLQAGVIQESQAHRAVAERIQALLLILSTFRDDKERMRRRVKEDLRTSISEHSEYQGAVSRLRRTYEAKVEEVQIEASKEQDKDREQATTSWATTSEGGGNSDSGRPGGERRDSSTSSRGGDWERIPTPLPPASNQIAFISGATTSHSAAAAYRDPPKSTLSDALNSLSKRDWSGEKHRVNSIVRAVGGHLSSRVESNGSGTKEAKSPVKGGKNKNSAGKLRRDAEQADRDYRSSIFRLETLRLQRDRVNRSAASSLESSARELSSTLKDVFIQHCNDIVTLGQSEIAIGQHAFPEVDRIDPSSDAYHFVRQLPEGQIPPPEPPVYYINAFVGECKNLLFGVGLTDYVGLAKSNQLVPLIVSRCIGEIDARGLTFEGIYRVSGKLATIQQLVHRIEKDEVNFAFDPRDDPATVGGVLKLYLRQLPFPLFAFSAADRIAYSATFDEDPQGHLSSLARRLRRLPAPHQATLKTLVEHLSRVVEHEERNKMTASNLGIVFSTSVFGEDDSTTLNSLMHAPKDIVMELLIRHHLSLFEGLPIEVPGNHSRSASVTASVVSQENNRPRANFPGSPTSLQYSTSQTSHSRNTSSSYDAVPLPHIPTPLALHSPPFQQRPHTNDTPPLVSPPPVPNNATKPPPSPMLPSKSTDSVFDLYTEAAPTPPQTSSPVAQSFPATDPFLKHQRSLPHNELTSSPPPPLSAARGRQSSEGSSNPNGEQVNPGSRRSTPGAPQREFE